jgi:hypothetical protein
VLTLLGVAMGAIDGMNMSSEDPGAWGLLLGAAGVGMLIYHAVANRFR